MIRERKFFIWLSMRSWVKGAVIFGTKSLSLAERQETWQK